MDFARFANPFKTEADSYDAGKRSARDGCNEDNCHFSYFATPELTKAWERGRDEAWKMNKGSGVDERH